MDYLVSYMTRHPDGLQLFLRICCVVSFLVMYWIQYEAKNRNPDYKFSFMLQFGIIFAWPIAWPLFWYFKKHPRSQDLLLGKGDKK